MTHPNYLKRFTLGLTGLSLFLSACAPQTSAISAGQGAASLAPRPSDVLSERSQLLRFRGQTSFMNPTYGFMRDGGVIAAEPEAASKSQDSGAERAQQESDVFKVGKRGSKLLYLLNQARGLQVVSFADGAEMPKLVGRVNGTGNSPTEMYYVEKSDRLIVLEHRYEPRTYKSLSSLVVYDVKDATRPYVSAKIDLKGSIADSRIVGDILYVATSEDDKGAVTSFDLSTKELRRVGQHRVSMRVSGAENMNIINVEKNGQMKYYLVATLSESGWGWWDRSSVIEVVDISDATGRIKPVMSIAAKGMVRERSQTLIKNDTLIVTSNYFVDRTNQDRGIARIAVETFRFPTEESETITENEALRRKLNIDHALEGLHGQERDEALAKLVEGEKEGIKGRFIASPGEGLRKMMPDSVVTVGDGSGLSANLQDVRYEDGLLYAFWVPANEIDPFDLFDISKPEEGVKYVSRLHFDGWIQRAIPMTVGGRRFVLGLGWIVPVVNNEQGRRQPQVMAFEIVESRGKLRAIDVAQLTLEGSNIWSNFNGQDKEIEVRFDGAGVGEVLFKASRYDQQGHSDGGQILKFDMTKVLGEDYDGILKQGPFLSGGSDWIRRVFTNSEINRINSFSDRALATFGFADKADASTLSPISILELARNMRAYENLKMGVRTFGVQVISDWYSTSGKDVTVLRLVDAKRADEEKSGVLSEIRLPGSYSDHSVDPKTGEMLVLTNRYEGIKNKKGRYDYRNTVTVTKIAATPTAIGPTLSKVGDVSWAVERKESFLPIGLRVGPALRYSYYHGSGALVRLGSGQLLAQADSTVYAIGTQGALTAAPIDLGQCSIAERQDVEVQVLEGRAFLASKERIKSASFEGLDFTRNMIAPIELSGTKATCGAEVNIPGRALAFTTTGEILVEDEWVQDIVKQEKADEVIVARDGSSEELPMARRMSEGYQLLNRHSLVSLKMSGGKATLVDELESNDVLAGASPLSNGEFVRIKGGRGWGSSSHELEFLSVGSDGALVSEVRGLQLDLASGARLVVVVKHPSAANSYLGLIRSGGEVQAISWDQSSKQPQVMKLSILDERFQAIEAAVKVQLPTRYDYGATTHFTPELKSFEVIDGLSGINQILVEL